MLRRDFCLEIKAVSEAGEIEGYGSTFGGKPDSYGDIIEAGAFAETIAGHKRDGTMPLMLWGHQASELPIGDWLDMAEDRKGLWLKGQLDLDDPMGIRVHSKLKRRSIRGLSIGFDTLEKRTDEKKPGIRFLTKLDLWEVSVVNFPANRRATVTGVKEVEDLRARLAAGGRLEVREWEELLKRSFDLSNAEAERAVRINLKGQGEPGGTADHDARAFLEALRA